MIGFTFEQEPCGLYGEKPARGIFKCMKLYNETGVLI